MAFARVILDEHNEIVVECEVDSRQPVLEILSNVVDGGERILKD